MNFTSLNLRDRRPSVQPFLLPLAALTILLAFAPSLSAQRTVNFPPADSKPPPPVKQPPKSETSSETRGIQGEGLVGMRKTEDRTPPPPNTLTVMYKVQYGETLKYTHPDGHVQEFEQWKSFENDAFNLVKYTNERLQDGNNYRYDIEPLNSPKFDPADIPMLYMTGDYAFVFSKSEVENLRRFLTDGGTIVFNAARGRDEFSLAVIDQMRRVFPQKQFMRLPADHPVYNARYRVSEVLCMVNGVQSQKPMEAFSIDIGTRAVAILIPDGLGTAWSGEKYHPAGKHIVGESAIRLGVNLIAYVLGNTEYGRFLAQEFPTYSGKTRPGDVFRYAVVQYSGSWDVNPAVQNSLLMGLFDNTRIGVDYTPHVVTLDDPNLANYPLIFMTGHYKFQFTPEEKAGLKRYLQRGGLLVASAAAGLKPFDMDFRREIKEMFPKDELVRLPPTHPIFAGGWNPVDHVVYTQAALADNPGLEFPEFYSLYLNGRPAVLYTPYDFLSGLNRESNSYAKGLDSNDALRTAINIITHALSY